jgi:hypothetical protein
MYEKKAMALSDLDATNFELEQEALSESWDSYGRQEHGRKQRALPVTPAGRRRPRPGAASPPSIASNPCLPIFSESECSVAAIAPHDTTSSATASAAVAAVASTPAADLEFNFEGSMGTDYPQSIQELVMNGFELKRVVRAYELVGDNFDDLLSFLISTSASSNH